MSEREFRSWLAFYRRHPFDDRHRYHRPAALIAGAGRGQSVERMLDWLEPKPLPLVPDVEPPAPGRSVFDSIRNAARHAALRRE